MASYYSVFLYLNYNGSVIEGFYAGDNEFDVAQLATHPNDTFRQYQRVDGAINAANSVTDEYNKQIRDQDNKIVARYNQNRNMWIFV